jgi:hypothetical protein
VTAMPVIELGQWEVVTDGEIEREETLLKL